MAIQDDYRNTDYLDDVSFIAGTDFLLHFPIYDANKVPVNINASTMKWFLCPYGQPDYNILEIDAIISASNIFSVTISSSSTDDLGGVYIQQTKVADYSGSIIRPAQGRVIIRAAIPANS